MTKPPATIYYTAVEMGAPVARGDLPLVHAHAALLVDTLREERSGALEGHKATDVLRLKKHLLKGEVERQTIRRDLAAHRIERLIKPMIVAHKPPGAIFAEAHGHNGQAGFPLTEEEVNDIVKITIYWSLPRAPGGRRHVG